MNNNVFNKPFAAAAAQNQDAILPVLAAELEAGDSVLEIGAGTGQHVCHFAQQLPNITWQPSELRERLPGIQLWLQETTCENILPPIELDITVEPWPEISVDVVYSANTFHIVSWASIECLFAGCARSLKAGGKLCVYGPFKVAGAFTAESNARFDQMLRSDDPLSGVRDTAELDALALSRGFEKARLVTLPSNNFMAVWERA